MQKLVIEAYTNQRAQLVARLIELSKHTQWDGYSVAAHDIQAEIGRIDRFVADLPPEIPSAN